MTEPKMVLHHDDSPCEARLHDGYCPECRLTPDMQSTCLWPYCPTCDLPLKNLVCSSCGQTFVRAGDKKTEEPASPPPPAEAPSPTITVTPKAIEAIARMRASGGIPADKAMRVGVRGGGCSGFSYALGWDSIDPLNDYGFNFPPNVEIVVSREAMPYLAGVTLDYEDGLNGTGFKFNNPNAKSSCGCGESFTT